MIGSKSKVETMRREFLEKGWATADEWARVRAPIGLDIGSKTVEEIAVSIAARTHSAPAIVRAVGRSPPITIAKKPAKTGSMVRMTAVWVRSLVISVVAYSLASAFLAVGATGAWVASARDAHWISDGTWFVGCHRSGFEVAGPAHLGSRPGWRVLHVRDDRHLRHVQRRRHLRHSFRRCRRYRR
jgi:hypothetical protein